MKGEFQVFNEGRRRSYSSRYLFVGGAVCAVIGLAIGVLIGWFSHKQSTSDTPPVINGQNAYLVSLQRLDIGRKAILENVNKENLRDNLRDYTSKPRLPGSQFSLDLANELGRKWRENGLDVVHVPSYSVLLSYPNKTNPNKIEIIQNDGTSTGIESAAFEKPLDAEGNNSDVVPPYNSYAPAGVVMADLSLHELPKPEHFVVSFYIQEFVTFGKPLDAEEINSDFVPPYNYAPAGIAMIRSDYFKDLDKQGDLVYVNYGRIEDIQFLVNNMSMNLTGTIGIARYGKIFRGDKVKIAERFGMLGLVMYTDPSDFNIDDNSTYPDSWWMPDTGVQRGTVGYFDGDLLTKFYPATDYAVRAKLDDIKDLKPGIPSQPISYGDAEKFLSRMTGPEAPVDWRGRLKITYRLGPGFKNNTLKAKLTVNNYMKETPINDVIGYIKGQEEPDRYVLMGNHHDAWVFGAIDPLSGTAVVTELTRVFGQLLKQGHRPRRTIVFCSWGGEEQGLIGSTEWVEEHAKVLYERGIAYLNVDYAVDFTAYPAVGVSPLLQDAMYQATKMEHAKVLYERGIAYLNVDYAVDFTAYPAVGVSPLLQDAMYQATKIVPNPTPSDAFPTIYDIWKNKTAESSSEPSVYYSLGSGSDMATFYQRMGVPSTDFWYTYNENDWDILSYPLYHSAYETFHMYTNFIDPTFNYTQGMAHLLGILAWNLANEMVLQYDVRRYSKAVEGYVKNLVDTFGDMWRNHNVNIEALQSAASNFTEATNYFHSQLSTVDNSSDLHCRMVNDKMIQLERAFIDPEGLPNRTIYKHILYAPSQFDGYSDNDFPAIVDVMYEIQTNGCTDLWDLLKKQVYIATYFIQMAAETLLDIGL